MGGGVAGGGSVGIRAVGGGVMADRMTSVPVPGMAVALGDGNPQYSPRRPDRSPDRHFPWAFKAQGGPPLSEGGMCATARGAWVAEDAGMVGAVGGWRDA